MYLDFTIIIKIWNKIIRFLIYLIIIIKINKFVSFDGINSLDNILKDTDLPKNFDFLSIDVDGCDYHIFENLNLFKPKIVIIEFNHLIPNEVDFIQKKDFNIKQGSSAKSIINLAKNKNYHLVASTTTNLIFIHENYKHQVEKEDVLFDKAVIDKVSLNIIAGSTVDFKQEMIGESFTINNPKASASCGCGLSFSV